MVAPIDISSLRHERASRVGHHMLSHLRTEAYPVYRESGYPRAPNHSPRSVMKRTSLASPTPSVASLERPNVNPRSRVALMHSGFGWPLAGLLTLAALVGSAACGGGSSAPASSDASKTTAANAAVAPTQTVEWFTDVAQSSGIDFTHVNGASGKIYYPRFCLPVSHSSTTTTTAIRRVSGAGTSPDDPKPDPALRGRLYRKRSDDWPGREAGAALH